MPSHLPVSHALLALAVVAVWGTNFVVIRFALDVIPPLALAVLRFALAFLPAALLIARPPVPLSQLAMYGVLIGVGQFGLLYLAIQGAISPGLASLVVQTQVFFTIGLAMLFDGERPRGHQWLALALAVGGLVWIAARGASAGATPLGVAMVLLAALGWAAGNMVGRRARGQGGLRGVVERVRGAAAAGTLAVVRGTGGGVERPRARGPRHLDGRGVAGGRQHALRLCRVGLAARPPPRGHHLALGVGRAGVRPRQRGVGAGRADAGVEAVRLGAGDRRAGDQRPVAALALGDLTRVNRR
jgi:hypothetical protein